MSITQRSNVAHNNSRYAASAYLKLYNLPFSPPAKVPALLDHLAVNVISALTGVEKSYKLPLASYQPKNSLICSPLTYKGAVGLTAVAPALTD